MLKAAAYWTVLYGTYLNWALTALGAAGAFTRYQRGTHGASGVAIDDSLND